MQKKAKRDNILYAHIQKVNMEWIYAQMKKYGYSSQRGKSEFLDELFNTLRTRSPANPNV